MSLKALFLLSVCLCCISIETISSAKSIRSLGGGFFGQDQGQGQGHGLADVLYLTPPAAGHLRALIDSMKLPRDIGNLNEYKRVDPKIGIFKKYNKARVLMGKRSGSWQGEDMFNEPF